MEDKISNAVETAFEAEEKAVEETTATETVKDDAQPSDTTSPEQPEQKPAETEESKPEEERPVEEPTPAPKQLKSDFAKTKWNTLDKDTQSELSRLAAENERNYLRSNEAEHNAKMFRRTLEPVQGYISEVAQGANISENEAIRNCVGIVQNLNDKPTLTACEMIGKGNIVFEDPVAVINTIARTYGIDVKGDMQQRNIPEGYYATAAQAKYEARQAKYVKPEEVDADVQAAIVDYVENTPGIKALTESPTLSEKFMRQIQMERQADPNSSDITIINRAAELFEYALAQEQAKVQPAPQVPNVAEQKMAKVVAPKASNPANTETPEQPVVWDSMNLNKETARSAEKSVKEALRAMGLDD